MLPTELVPWLALYHLPAISDATFQHLLACFGEPEAVFEASPQALSASAIPAEALASLQEYRSSREYAGSVEGAVDSDLRWLEQDPEHHILSCRCRDYPPLLREIPDPPTLLYVAGKTASLHGPMLAMVGSRKPSAGGRRQARRFAAELAAQNITISSGLAFGIDRESHVGALQGGGRTVAVLGSGLERIYPERHRGLAGEIREKGALISEFPLHAEPEPWHFPRRNRIVTGLSLGVLVVEASLKSGSLISARCAMEQGREVFAMPGNIDNHQARGCHLLLKQGARLVENIDDIAEELMGYTGLLRPAPATAEGQLALQLPPDLSPLEHQVLAQIGHDQLGFDHLRQLTRLTSEQLLSTLAALELKGLIYRQAGAYTLAPRD